MRSFALGAVLALTAAAASAAPQARIEAGALEGAQPPDAPGAVFAGIPNAEPPVGGVGLPAWPRADGGGYLAFTMDGPTAKANLGAEPCGVFREWTLRRLGAN